jgi:hypothetical protein
MMRPVLNLLNLNGMNTRLTIAYPTLITWLFGAGTALTLEHHSERMAPTPEGALLMQQGWNPVGSGLQGSASALLPDGAGGVFVGGNFLNAGGLPDADYIAKWDGSAWSALGTGMNNRVAALLLRDNTLYAGGAFIQAGGQLVSRVARWDGSNWQALGGGLGNTVNALADYQGSLVAGGRFTKTGDNTWVNYIAAWNGSAWIPLDQGLNGEVFTLAVFDGYLYAGGSFTGADSQGGGDYLARWDGTIWSAVPGSNLNGAVRCMLSEDGLLTVGGEFTAAGIFPQANHLAIWDGTTWFPVGDGLNAPVNALARHNGQLVAGGEFNITGNPSESRHVARWDGQSWSGLDIGTDEVVLALASLPTELYAGGDFDIAGTVPDTRKIARWEESSLAATFTYLRTSLIEDDILLQWDIAEGWSEDPFIVEHRQEDTPFRDIALVAGPPSPSLSHRYQFLHEAPGPGNHYYRLRHEDSQGIISFSGQISARLPFSGQLKVFPTPCPQMLTVQVPPSVTTSDTRLAARLTDLGGRTVWQGNIGQGNNLLDLSAILPGHYFIVVERPHETWRARVVRCSPDR